MLSRRKAKLERAESYGSMHLSGLLHCQYLPSLCRTLKSRGWRDCLIFDLTPQHRDICHMLVKVKQCKEKIHKENSLTLQLFLLFYLFIYFFNLDQHKYRICCARARGVETNDIIMGPLLSFFWRKAIRLVSLLRNKH